MQFSSVSLSDRNRITTLYSWSTWGGSRGHDLEGLQQAHANMKDKLILQNRPEMVSMAEVSLGIEKDGV